MTTQRKGLAVRLDAETSEALRAWAQGHDARPTQVVRAWVTEGLQMHQGERERSCSFCGKRATQVEKVVAGPYGVCICSECIDLCA